VEEGFCTAAGERAEKMHSPYELTFAPDQLCAIREDACHMRNLPQRPGHVSVVSVDETV
jgi:hypothetical protein